MFLADGKSLIAVVVPPSLLEVLHAIFKTITNASHHALFFAPRSLASCRSESTLFPVIAEGQREKLL